MKRRSMAVGILVGATAAIAWSIVFVHVLSSAAGIGVGICLGVAFGIPGCLIFSKKENGT